ncbi:MAG: type II restriction endonuclease, partial [Bradyrhizobium sp.]
RIPSRVRDDARPPLWGQDGAGSRTDLGQARRGIFFEMGLDRATHGIGRQVRGRTTARFNLSNVDVDGFIAFSLSVHNRRKSRAGYSLEHHLTALFKARGVRFERGAETENRNKPDFLFPGQKEYRDAAFDTADLTVLGAKSTCKDRWRQVLSEASRMQHKHLVTLEPGITENQAEEMKAKHLQLVVPAPHPIPRP